MNHPFDLRGTRVGYTFLGCPSCGFYWKEPVACVPQCPDCSRGMRMYTVTQEDLDELAAQKPDARFTFWMGRYYPADSKDLPTWLRTPKNPQQNPEYHTP